MARVIITRPNASEFNNGVHFEPYEHGGMISEEIDAEQAAQLFPLDLDGYELLEERQEKMPEPRVGRSRKPAVTEDKPPVNPEGDSDAGAGAGGGEQPPQE